jgi:arylformamidase
MSQGTQAVSEQWIDISLDLHDGMVHWPDNPPVQIGFVLAIDKGDASNVSKLSMGAHTGTHMDAPLHFIPGGQSIDTMPLSATIGRARVIEIQDTESIKVAELEHQRIQMGERILFKTINSTQYWQTDEFEKNYVFISKEAAEYLGKVRYKLSALTISL